MAIGKSNTRVFDANGLTYVQYHDTHVVIFDGQTICLNSGGHLTKTTKKRMNEASEQYHLGYYVFQKARRGIREWWVTFRGEDLRYHDGMILA